ncbi:MAG: helix-turn-helix transcriptional regulator [Bacteroidota bacterium]
MIIGNTAQFTFYEPNITVQDIHNSEFIEQSGTITQPYGRVEWKQWYFDGIRIWHALHFYHKQFSFNKVNDLNVVSLEFNLRGTYVIRHVGQVYRTQSQRHNIIYTPGVNNTFENVELEGENFKIQFLPEVFLRIVEDSNDTLKRFAGKMMEGKPVVISPTSLALTVELHRAIHDLLHCQFQGGLKKLFFLSKCIEVLVLQAEAYHRAQQASESLVSKNDDQERISFARDYLIKNVQSPPSLSQLARIVGVNEYKLKRGFKDVFHKTAFGYLADYRLEQAKQALHDQNKSISDIAYELGYSSPQHFSSAFKKKFGISPRMAKR